MNRKGKLSLITFINLREMKSTNKKEIQSLISCQKETFFQKFIILFSNFESIFLKKITINIQLYRLSFNHFNIYWHLEKKRKKPMGLT